MKIDEREAMPGAGIDEPPENALYVGEDGHVLTGENAKRALAAVRGDSSPWEPSGVVRVSRERWNAAQRYERNVWMNLGSHALDDRNFDHARHFEEYRVLEGRRFERAIELGCGPFTNLRLLARVCEIRSCTLLDPLVDEYRKHRHCTYRDGIVAVRESRWSEILGASLPGRVLRRLMRRIRPTVVVDGVPVAEYLSTPIEEMSGDRVYDLVVMINVLEHCFDAREIFSRLLRITRPASIFVFHDKLFAADRVAALARSRFDTGHPLRVDGTLIRGFLAENFSPTFERTVRLHDVHDGVDLSEDALYYVGERF